MALRRNGIQEVWTVGHYVAIMTCGNKRLENTQVRYTLNQKSLNPKHLILLVMLSTTPSLLTSTISTASATSSPCQKRPNTRENGCWLPQSDHIQRWYTFPDQTRPFSSPPQKNISVFQIFSSFSFSVFLLLQKQIISFFKYSPPFLSPFFFSSAEKNIHFFFKYFPPLSFLPFLGI